MVVLSLGIFTVSIPYLSTSEFASPVWNRKKNTYNHAHWKKLPSKCVPNSGIRDMPHCYDCLQFLHSRTTASISSCTPLQCVSYASVLMEYSNLIKKRQYYCVCMCVCGWVGEWVGVCVCVCGGGWVCNFYM